MKKVVKKSSIADRVRNAEQQQGGQRPAPRPANAATPQKGVRPASPTGGQRQQQPMTRQSHAEEDSDQKRERARFVASGKKIGLQGRKRSAGHDVMDKGSSKTWAPPFLKPEFQQSHTILFPSTKKGGFIFRPVPLLNVETPQGIDGDPDSRWEPFRLPDLGGEHNYGEWYKVYPMVRFFGSGENKESFVVYDISVDVQYDPSDNPYESINNFLMRQCNWKKSMDKLPPKWLPLVDKWKTMQSALFQRPKIDALMYGFVYKAGDDNKDRYFEAEGAPLGIRADEPLVLVYVPSQVLDDIKTRWAETDPRDDSLLYPEGIGVNEGVLIYMEAAEKRSVVTDKKAKGFGYQGNLSQYYISAKKHAIDLSLSEEQQDALYERMSYGNHWSHIINVPTPVELAETMAKAMPELYELAEIVWRPNHPEWFTDKVEAAFNRATTEDFRVVADRMLKQGGDEYEADGQESGGSSYGTKQNVKESRDRLRDKLKLRQEVSEASNLLSEDAETDSYEDRTFDGDPSPNNTDADNGPWPDEDGDEYYNDSDGAYYLDEDGNRYYKDEEGYRFMYDDAGEAVYIDDTSEDDDSEDGEQEEEEEDEDYENMSFDGDEQDDEEDDMASNEEMDEDYEEPVVLRQPVKKSSRPASRPDTPPPPQQRPVKKTAKKASQGVPQGHVSPVDSTRSKTMRRRPT